ncbi:MAG: hypothetical protein J1F66_04285 [Clostridiales bacterium]|nr:hypothetical protein [Clostridiales bacterium]
MASITQERLKELLEIYAKLKEEIIEIDNKYSLTYVEPEIVLPDSLNLQKMTYTPKSVEELNELAEQYVAAAIISKQRGLDSNYSTKLKTLGRKRTEAARDLTEKLKKADNDYAEALEKLQKKLINNGLLFSTTASKYRETALADYANQKNECNLSYTQDLSAIDTEENDLEAVYKESCEKLEEEKQALITKRYQVLVEAEEKAKTNVDKYNNGIEEKEQRYQYTRAKFIESMRRAERDRVLTMTKLYLQLGEVSYRDRMLREKYSAAQDAFWPLRRNEANVLLSYDSFLNFHLESYYSTFVDWVNTSLLEPN